MTLFQRTETSLQNPYVPNFHQTILIASKSKSMFTSVSAIEKIT